MRLDLLQLQLGQTISPTEYPIKGEKQIWYICITGSNISNFNCNYVGLIATMILIFDQAWGQNVSFLKLVLWLLMALDGTVKSILIRLDFDGLSRCTTVDGCQKIKV